jgi:Family of unknown function (DUF6526)
MSEPQSYANHRRFVPLYHYVGFGILTINLLWSLYRLIWGLPQVPIFDRLLSVAVACTLLITLFYARVFALAAQDRVIRLEESLRMERLLPADLKARIPEVTRGQFIGLRFASDEELADLVRKVLDGKIRKPGEIKQMVRSWRTDWLRV